MKMTKHYRKPVQVRAYRFDGGSHFSDLVREAFPYAERVEVEVPMTEYDLSGRRTFERYVDGTVITIHSRHGDSVNLTVGDWLICEDGEWDIISNAAFEQDYFSVTEVVEKEMPTLEELL